jgi:hypothetical protein
MLLAGPRGRNAGVALVVAAGLLAANGALVRWTVCSDHAREQVERALSKEVGAEVRIESLSPSLGGSFVARGVRFIVGGLGGRRVIFYCRRAAARFSMRHQLRGKL